MFCGFSRKDAYPSLPLPGALAAAAGLLILTLLGVHLGAAAMPIAVLAGAVTAGMLLLHRTVLSVLVPVLCAAAALLTASDPAAAGFLLLFLPLGFCSAFCVFAGYSRMKAVVLTSVFSGAVGTVYTGAVLLLHRTSPAAALEMLKNESAALLASVTVPTETGEMTALLTEESARTLISYTLLLTPAMTVCGLFLAAYLTTGLLRRMLSLLNAEADFFPASFQMVPGRSAAALYMISQIVTYLFAVSRDTEPLYYAFYNVSLIFLLPLSVFGLKTLIRRFRTADSISTMGRTALIFLVILIAAAGLYWFLTFAAFYGVFTVFRRGPDTSDPPTDRK